MEKYSLEEQKRAVYALNMCTVSVGQIIDYKDINILEQEYDAILNNFNIQKLPKDDESLLHILTHLLDTITFFRISEEEKKMIEKEYQHKLKNAIWNSLPNIALLISGSLQVPAKGGHAKGGHVKGNKAGIKMGSVASVVTSIALTVGIGYMNYRKNKADYILEKDKADWQLYKTELDQFNQLQRELFTTSWKMAKSYGYDDKYRLSERQIHLYNEILNEPDCVIKFERLKSIESEFSDAYPAFNYFYANAANMVGEIIGENYEGSKESKEYYIGIAKTYYRKMLDNQSYDLLREDPILCSCVLEYCDLLDADTDKEEIITYINRAEGLSGGSPDILELIAIEYLKIGEVEKAMSIFKRLLYDGYNEVANAQILSYYYVKKGEITERNFLCRCGVDENYLYPVPSSDKNVDEIFIRKQILLLKQTYGRALRDYYTISEIKFNELINTNHSVYFKQDLLGFFDAFSREIAFIIYAADDSDINEIAELVAFSLEDKLQILEEDNSRNKKRNKKVYEKITFEVYVEIVSKINHIIDGLLEKVKSSSDDCIEQTMKEISDYDAQIRSFCHKVDIADIHKTYDMIIRHENKLLIPLENLITQYEKEHQEILDRCVQCIQGSISNITDMSDVIVIKNDDNKYMFEELVRNNGKLERYEKNMIAIIKPCSEKEDTLVLYPTGVTLIHGRKCDYQDYKDVIPGDKMYLKIGKNNYKNSKVNMHALLALFKKLQNVSEKDGTSNEVINSLLDDTELEQIF